MAFANAWALFPRVPVFVFFRFVSCHKIFPVSARGEKIVTGNEFKEFKDFQYETLRQFRLNDSYLTEPGRWLSR